VCFYAVLYISLNQWHTLESTDRSLQLTNKRQISDPGSGPDRPPRQDAADQETTDLKRKTSEDSGHRSFSVVHYLLVSAINFLYLPLPMPCPQYTPVLGLNVFLFLRDQLYGQDLSFRHSGLSMVTTFILKRDWVGVYGRLCLAHTQTINRRM
jgi:hypothetical protein